MTVVIAGTIIYAVAKKTTPQTDRFSNHFLQTSEQPLDLNGSNSINDPNLSTKVPQDIAVPMVSRARLEKAFPHQTIPQDLIISGQDKAQIALASGVIEPEQLENYIIAFVRKKLDSQSVAMDQQPLNSEYMGNNR